MKAIALVSGGLDSLISAKLVMEKGIDVLGVYFALPFMFDEEVERVGRVIRGAGTPLKVVKLGRDFLRILKAPMYGYGSGMNPCMDCHILMLKKAKEVMEKEGASFVITGEVLGQRPMTQRNKRIIRVIEEEAGLLGKVLRPLSGRLFPPTEPERLGFIKREELLAISGRRRRAQLEIAERLGIKEYLSPAGGCPLTNEEFARRLRDLLSNERLTIRKLLLLRIGRHFKCGKSRIIVARSEAEEKKLQALKGKKDLLLSSPETTSLLTHPWDEESRRIALSLTALYSKGRCVVKVDGEEFEAHPISRDEAEGLRI